MRLKPTTAELAQEAPGLSGLLAAERAGAKAAYLIAVTELDDLISGEAA